MLQLEKILNREQYTAVANLNGPFLILAGAGSGKTRVITYKIANLIENGIPQERILAVTFTNKAAKEMKERVSEILNKKRTKILITTFHALGVYILKKEIKNLGYRDKFSIYDETDSKKLITNIVNELKLPIEKYDPNILSYQISNIKMNLKDKIEDNNLKTIYQQYNSLLKTYNAVDFDDLIKLPLELFISNEEILKKYQKKWQYILVDEYQDTSLMQYFLVKLLAKEHRNISIVGDDDQSIYSWRGANSENIRQFELDFYPVNEIKLEQNYRSTSNILKAANEIIKNNCNRKEKKLWTSLESGDLIKVYEAENEEDEANFVYMMIRNLINQGYSYKDFAILFRMNSQSRAFEEVFRENDIPYKLIGATNFFERAEIRDILSYLRFLANLEDEVALLRIINNPKRGIGNNTINALMEHAKATNSSLYSCIKDFIRSGILGKHTTSYLEDFYKLIEKYREKIFIPRNISKATNELVEEINYRDKLLSEIKDPKKINYRMNNINQLIQSINRYEKDPDNFEPNIYEYLLKVSIQTKDDDENQDNKINMLSIHSAKGLEFKVVFIAGVEEGLLPHIKTVEETGSEEEERRLFYVAITRAREKLFLSYTTQRMKFNEVLYRKRSHFIDELPNDVVQEVIIENEIDGKKALDEIAKKLSRKAN